MQEDPSRSHARQSPFSTTAQEQRHTEAAWWLQEEIEQGPGGQRRLRGREGLAFEYRTHRARNEASNADELSAYLCRNSTRTANAKAGARASLRAASRTRASGATARWMGAVASRCLVRAASSHVLAPHTLPTGALVHLLTSYPSRFRRRHVRRNVEEWAQGRPGHVLLRQRQRRCSQLFRRRGGR